MADLSPEARRAIDQIEDKRMMEDMVEQIDPNPED